MVATEPDWRSIDESLRDDIPRLRLGGRKPFIRLNSTLDTMLDIKAVATKKQIHVPEIVDLLEQYLDAIAQGKHLKGRAWWKSLRRMRDWRGSKDEFKENCNRVWNFSHQTSFMVNTRARAMHADNSAAVPQEPIRRRRSADGLVQAEPNLDLDQPHNPFDDPLMRSTPLDAGLVAQSSNKNCTNANTLQEETIQRIAAKIWEQFTLHGRSPGQWVPQTQTINHFHGCNVRPGGEDNKGAAVNKCPSPTEVKGNGTNDIDDTSDHKHLPDQVTLDLLGHYDVSTDDSDED
ncbi:hypothetical protein EDD22DRAFT_875890 [Suillus occidentalis]|nr:hypothetical protein EDD22DRAFT_875890 [Suillus occidentalis]